MTGAPVVLALDGGGSKTDVVAVDLDGAVVARERGGGANPQVLGWPAVRAELDRLRTAVLRSAGDRPVLAQHVYLAGLDLPEELVAARSRLLRWTDRGPLTVDNDLFALLRAGTESPDAAVVVCGTGINAAGVRADGATARFPALGHLSGDWGGGGELGPLALWHAVRSEDGRGPRTVLQRSVPAALGAQDVRTVVEDLHFGRRSRDALVGLTPLVLEAAAGGDLVAVGLVARQAEEVVTMAEVVLRRLALLDEPVPVVLGGGVLAARDPLLTRSVLDGLAAVAPLAAPSVVTAAPVVGAVLLALESVGASREALARAEEALQPLTATR